MTSVAVRPPLRAPHAWWLFLVVGAGLVVLYRVLPGEGASSACYIGVGVLSLAAMAAGIRLHRPFRRAPWLVLVASQAISVVADAVGAVIAATTEVDRFPTTADAFYLAAYPVLAAALVMLTRGRRPARDVEGLLDGFTVLIGVSLLTMVALGTPAAAAAQDSSPLARLVAQAYPVLDLIILTLLAALFTTPGLRTPALKLLCLGLVLVVAADVSATAMDLMTFASTSLLDPVWLASYVVLGAALLHPSLYELSVPARVVGGQLNRSRLVATGLATLVAPGVLVAEHLLGSPISVWPIALASAAMFLLVVGRMTIVIRQIAAAQAERERAQAALAYQATHDSLTGLPNRAHGLTLIGGSMARAQRSGGIVGLLFVDLDGFKAVNDSYGHRAGDEVLQVVAARMLSVVREGDMVGRLGGDEFMVLLEPVVETESAMAVAERLVAEVSAPIALQAGHPVRVGASVGVAINQDGGTDAEGLLNEADTAAYRAKRLGRGRVEVFGESLRRELQERSDVERGLRRAIEQDSLVLFYEPVVDISTGAEVGYEVQVRWDRPGVGLIASPEFRPVAALSDLIFDLDTWVMRQAARQLGLWNRLGGGALKVAVDLTGRHLARARVLEDVRDAVAEAGIDPAQLVVEVTDTTLIDRVVGYVNLGEIRSSGVLVSLADFGTGYSSVRRLQQLPIDLVSLDGGFLDWHTAPGAVLLRLTVEGVRNFGLPLIVSGVADAEHFTLLTGMGCELLKGPYFAGPYTAEEVTARLSRQQATV